MFFRGGTPLFNASSAFDGNQMLDALVSGPWLQTVCRDGGSMAKTEADWLGIQVTIRGDRCTRLLWLRGVAFTWVS